MNPSFGEIHAAIDVQWHDAIDLWTITARISSSIRQVQVRHVGIQLYIARHCTYTCVQQVQYSIYIIMAVNTAQTMYYTQYYTDRWILFCQITANWWKARHKFAEADSLRQKSRDSIDLASSIIGLKNKKKKPVRSTVCYYYWWCFKENAFRVDEMVLAWKSKHFIFLDICEITLHPHIVD